MKTTVIHHSADFDGIFCREIARKFLPEAELIGWDHGDPKIPFPAEGTVYILDLSPDCLGGDTYDSSRIIWIDHHKSSIEKWPSSIPGYRIDGVAACRLAWQWFANVGGPVNRAEGQHGYHLPDMEAFRNRQVEEPVAVMLAGEYDIWDKRDERAETFQFGLRSQELSEADWFILLTGDGPSEHFVERLLAQGGMLQRYQQRNDANVVNFRSFLQPFDGLTFLALNTARCNSLSFAAKDVPETGHDALMGFYWTGKSWKVSLYHARHRTDLDLSKIAVKFGGGGHRGACGFECKGALPFCL